MNEPHACGQALSMYLERYRCKPSGFESRWFSSKCSSKLKNVPSLRYHFGSPSRATGLQIPPNCQRITDHKLVVDDLAAPKINNRGKHFPSRQNKSVTTGLHCEATEDPKAGTSRAASTPQTRISQRIGRIIIVRIYGLNCNYSAAATAATTTAGILVWSPTKVGWRMEGGRRVWTGYTYIFILHTLPTDCCVLCLLCALFLTI